MLVEQLILAFLFGTVCDFIYYVSNCGIISDKLVWKCDQPHNFLNALLSAFWQTLLALPKAKVPVNFMFKNTNCEAAILLVETCGVCVYVLMVLDKSQSWRVFVVRFGRHGKEPFFILAVKAISVGFKIK